MGRPISKTPVRAKILEKMIITDLEYDTKLTLNDLSQYGNTKGCSTTHYLIKATNKAFKSTDAGGATTAITIDYSKAFDLVDHSTLIKKFVKANVRNKLMTLIISFLSNRKHYTKIKDTKSDLVTTTCGVPQGTLCGPKFFTALIHAITFIVSTYKFVDDKTFVHSFTDDCTPFLQRVLDTEAAETKANKMVLNKSKSSAITFNFSTNNSVPQNLLLKGNTLNSVSSINLLGVTISDDLRWKENTALICKKGNKKFYILRDLGKGHRKTELLLSTWKVLLRPITEYAAPLWHSGLSESDIPKLKSLKKKAVGMILGTIYLDHKRYYRVNGNPVSYKSALTHLNLLTLTERREALTTKFAIQNFKNERHKDFFEIKSNIRHCSRLKPIIKEHTCNTERLKNSAIPFMTRILNKMKLEIPNDSS